MNDRQPIFWEQNGIVYNDEDNAPMNDDFSGHAYRRLVIFDRPREETDEGEGKRAE